MKYLLSKSKFIRGLQCEKALFLDVFKPKLAWYDRETLDKFRKGRDFEYSFKATFPQGIDVSARLRSQIDRYPELTARLLNTEGEVVVFEAGFLFNSVLVLADVVHKHPDGAVDIYEVKNGTAVTDTFRRDVAVQHYVISQALPVVSPPTLFGPALNLSHFYCLYNDGQDGFVAEDLLDEARQQRSQIARHVARFKEVLANDEPAIAIGEHCTHPYRCPYQHYCQRLASTTLLS